MFLNRVHKMRSTFALLPASMVLALACHAAQAAQAAQGFADPVLGRWNVTLTAPNGKTYPSWFDIRLHTESSLMATVVGRFGSARHASAVSYKDGKLQLRVPRQYEGGTGDMVFDGVLDGERLTGRTVHEGGTAWSAQRAPVLPMRSVTTWGAPVALFNGRDLAGWRAGGKPCWHVRQGVLAIDGPCTNLISEEKFGDFKLHMEFKNVANGNSGLYLRGRYEIQISDAHGQAADPLRMGAVYGHVRPTVNATARAGEWQSLDVTLIGRYVTVVLNGTTVIDGQEIPGITGGALDNDEAAPGPVMLQGDHTAIAFRKITVAPAIN